MVTFDRILPIGSLLLEPPEQAASLVLALSHNLVSETKARSLDQERVIFDGAQQLRRRRFHFQFLTHVELV